MPAIVKLDRSQSPSDPDNFILVDHNQDEEIKTAYKVDFQADNSGFPIGGTFFARSPESALKEAVRLAELWGIPEVNTYV
ncbi:hypothetical protein [Microvirga arabica]|uniref:hypothetical protein n=1 Tax=Microvirga arabica TaxID=1128671 RepID=UPI001939F70A|nr:hypothetical protein [Microvirga arabica]MBM1172829.1 hypothetical protein [Microvirga arabica]